MSGHWPYIIAAYTICFVLLAADWFTSVFELRALKHDSLMRQRRDAGRTGPAHANAVNDLSNKDKPMDISNE